MGIKDLNRRIENVINIIYSELYKNSIPMGNWEILSNKYQNSKVKFWEKYYCPNNTQRKIIYATILKQKNLSILEKNNIKNRIFKGPRPTNLKCKKNV